MIFSFIKQEAPASGFSVLGAVSFGAVSFIESFSIFPYLGLGVNDLSTFLGLGKGVMQRIVTYFLILWLLAMAATLRIRLQKAKILLVKIVSIIDPKSTYIQLASLQHLVNGIENQNT